MTRSISARRLRRAQRRAAAAVVHRQGPPAMHERPTRAAMVRARMALVLTVALWVAYTVTAVVALARGDAFGDAWRLSGTVLFLAAVTLLSFSACMYLLARAGALPRFAAHRRARRADIDAGLATRPVRTLALLPSYAEEPALIRMGLWSASLQAVPDLRVVLLLDDAPEQGPDDPRAERLIRTRALADEIVASFAPVADAARAAVHELETDAVADDARAARVADVHEYAALWLRRTAANEPAASPVEGFFVDRVLLALADEFEASADALRGAESLARHRAVELASRVLWTFAADVSVFERKRYASLSPEPTKAMNLNAYLGLVGGTHVLERSDGGHETITVPECDVVLTLDADSMLLPEYAPRLIHELQRPGNERVAIIQTPYSAYRGERGRLERLAGATTDLQHIVHQGMSAFSATFWVGANAILRRSALEDLREETVEDGRRVTRFLRGATVIEDTESSIDLVAAGWTLQSYPERLSYSTTPPDFGSLAVQRRRWANGGLLVLPRLRSLILARRGSGLPMSLAERMLRANYLASITWVTLGLLVLLTLVPLDGALVSVALLLIAVPYFAEMAADLHRLGYRRRDVAGVYGLNLLLLPVNLAGTAASVAQAFTGTKAGFARTPKTDDRTPAGALFILAPTAIGAAATIVAVRAATEGAWIAGTFAAVTAACVWWALLRLVGIRAAASDVWLGWTEWIWVAVGRPDPAPDPAPEPAWRSVLDDGPLEPAVAR